MVFKKFWDFLGFLYDGNILNLENSVFVLNWKLIIFEIFIINILCFEVFVICFGICWLGFRWFFYVFVSKMCIFVVLVLFLIFLFVVDGDIDEEEEKFLMKCYGMWVKRFDLFIFKFIL